MEGYKDIDDYALKTGRKYAPATRWEMKDGSTEAIFPDGEKVTFNQRTRAILAIRKAQEVKI